MKFLRFMWLCATHYWAKKSFRYDVLPDDDSLEYQDFGYGEDITTPFLVTPKPLDEVK